MIRSTARLTHRPAGFGQRPPFGSNHFRERRLLRTHQGVRALWSTKTSSLQRRRRQRQDPAFRSGERNIPVEL